MSTNEVKENAYTKIGRFVTNVMIVLGIILLVLAYAEYQKLKGDQPTPTPPPPVAQVQAEATAVSYTQEGDGNTVSKAAAAANSEATGTGDNSQNLVTAGSIIQAPEGGCVANCIEVKTEVQTSAQAEAIVEHAPPPAEAEPAAVPMATGSTNGQAFTCSLFGCNPAKGALVSVVLDNGHTLACPVDPEWGDEGYVTCHGIPHDIGFRLVVQHDGKIYTSDRQTLIVSGTTVYPHVWGEVVLKDGKILPKD